MGDQVTQTSSTARYTYHNGYYDYTEKIFRGFQMVETATIPLLGTDVAVSAEAYRALAGQPRRKEVFSADPSDPKAAFPYLISQQTYDVVLRQTAPARLVCRVDGREEVTAHYERATVKDEQDQPELSIQDSRVQHRLTLQTDDYGNVLLEAFMEYSKPSSQLPNADDQRKQEETVVSYAEIRYTNAAKTYFQSPLSAKVQKYRVFPATAIGGKDRYAWEMIAQDDTCFLKEAVGIPLNADMDEQLKHTNTKGYRVLLADHRTIYTSTDLLEALPVGVVAEFSIVDRNSEYGSAGGRYVELNGEEGKWWTQSSRSIFGDDDPGHRLKTARTAFFIPSSEVDAYGNTSTVELGQYYLLANKTTNAMGSTMSTVSDYAKLASIMTIDANGNRVQTAPDPLGRAVGVAVLGNQGDSTGSSLGGFEGEVDQQTLDAFFTTPYGDTARSLLAKASQRTIYDIDSYRRSGVPSRVAELTGHDHVGKGTDLSPITVRITYLGGGGVAGPEVATLRGLASSHAFRPLPPPSDGTVPVTTTLRDPLGRVLGVLYPDQTWSKTRFTPWTKADYDAGNTSNVEDPATDDDVGSYFERLPRYLYYPTWRQKRMADRLSAEDKIAACQGDIYADAPTITHLDALGRTILTETGKGVNTRLARVDYNPRGQVGRLRDALDRTVEKMSYDLLGRQLHTANMDRGRCWLLSATDGLALLSWSDKQARKRSEYDALRRLKSVWRLSSEEHAVGMEVTKMTYGEGRPDDAASNLRGQVYRCRDQAGLLTNRKSDVLGGCTVSTRRYANEYRNSLPVDNVASDLGMTRRQYNVAGRLAALESFKKDGTGAATSSTKSIKYNANGMITDLMYGDEKRSTNTDDEQTQRLVATRTIRTIDNAALQDVSYTYDCRGKVVQTKDTAKIVVNDSDSTQEYHYDCLGRLVQATGRIQVDSQSKHLTSYSFNDDKLAGDSKTIRYTETYAYDKAGNMLTMSNTPNTAGYTGWTRTYTYAEQSCITAWETSNRLTRTEVGKVTEEYKYEGDAGRQGCMTYIPGYSHLSWNDDDRLHSFSTQNVGADSGNIPEMACRARTRIFNICPWGTSADPMSVADGLNLFAYVRNDPINFDDPGGTIKNRKYNRSLSESSSHEQAAGSSGTFSSLRDIPAAVARRLGSSLFDADPPPPVASGFTRLWRATDRARGIVFVRFGDVSAVRTTAIGNFNRPDEAAAYWGPDERLARDIKQNSRQDQIQSTMAEHKLDDRRNS
ncbi:RHS repeat-associated core domain protein, partial [Metarhizium brunneum ARSEF 3297]